MLHKVSFCCIIFSKETKGHNKNEKQKKKIVCSVQRRGLWCNWNWGRKDRMFNVYLRRFHYGELLEHSINRVELVQYFSPRDLMGKWIYLSWNGALTQHLKKISPFWWQFSQVFALNSTSLSIFTVSPSTHLGYARNFTDGRLRHRATTFVPMTLAYSLVFTLKTLLQFILEKSKISERGTPLANWRFH